MTTHATQQLRKEAAFIERYTEYYRRQFTAALQRPTVQTNAASMQCVRMCLEALDMINETKQAMESALAQMKN